MKDAISLIKKANYVFIIGNGGSAATANHFASDLLKVAKVRAVSLSSNESVLTAIANDDGYENIFMAQLKVFLQKGDLLITVSGSGESENILKAINFARKKGVGVYSFPTIREYNCTMQEAENNHLELAHKITKVLCEK